MTLLYKTAIYGYALMIRIASIFNSKAQQFVKGRKGWEKRVAEQIETNGRYIWFHCASLGEFEQGRPVMEAIRKRFPQYRLILTFFSPSGFEVRKNFPLADIVSYLPMDTPRNARTFLQIVNPEKAFFIKYEYWYFYISELKRRGIPFYLLSAIFRKDQHFFQDNIRGRWFRKMLWQFDHLFVQNEQSARLLSSVGIPHFSVSGDTRFDRVAAIASQSQELPIVEKFKEGYPVVIAGSTWKPGEEMLAAFIQKSPGVKFIIAPHEVSESNIQRIRQLLPDKTIRYSEATAETTGNYQVLIVDSIGLLSSLYRYGNIAYIGGGFGVGIHNILEAATFGLPVVFGPHYNKFKEAVDLADLGGAFPVHDQKTMAETLTNLLENSEERKKASSVCKTYVGKNVGSTNCIIKKVFKR